jgi:hypothetical protein
MTAISPGPTESGVRPIRVPEVANLDVLPYIRGRLTFAQSAVRLLATGLYDLLLVDLPRFMNNPAWLKPPLDLLPHVSLIQFKRMDGTFRTIAFSPNDAACIAASRASGQTLRFRCVDDPDLLNYPAAGFFNPQIRLEDDYRLRDRGLEEYFSAPWRDLDEAWAGATREMMFFTRYRASTTLRRILKEAGSGKRCILVCEYRLWWSIRKALESPLRDVNYLFRWKERPAAIRIEDPLEAWTQGLLDDYPALVAGFWEGLLAGDMNSFDKHRLLESVIDGVLAGKGLEESGNFGHASIRSRILFRDYLGRLTTASRRMIPEPAGQLFHAAEACGGAVLLKQLAASLLRYPRITAAARSQDLLGEAHDPFPGHRELISYHTGKPLFEDRLEGCSSCPSEWEDRRRVVDLVLRDLTLREERVFLGGEDERGVCWATRADYLLHKKACEQSRFLAHGGRCAGRPRRSRGSIEGGIHWKATLASMARGENAIHVKRRHSVKRILTALHDFTPVVFLFGHEEISASQAFCIYDSNAARRKRDLGSQVTPCTHSRPDVVYSVYCTRKPHSDFVLGGHIERRPLTSITILYSGHSAGPHRYDAIAKRKMRYQCRTTPERDHEIAPFSPAERGIAWAVKYAEDVVLVAAARGWRPSAALENYARARKIRLHLVELSAYQKEFRTRLSTMYFISTRLKNHPDHERIVGRFME